MTHKKPMISLVLFLNSFVTFFILSINSFARADGNVILLMLDGVRWQEVFHGSGRELSERANAPIFSFLWKELAAEGSIFGNVQDSAEMFVANPSFISLPAYQSVMAGTVQPCSSNLCDRVQVETLQERIIRELKLSKKQVATIASWEKIPKAVEHIEGASFVNAAFQDLNDGENDLVFKAINKAQKKDLPSWEEARSDKYTWAHAMHYLEKHRPRFMFVSLNDSDEWGHDDNYPQYITTLQQYDKWIKELVDRLKSMGEYGSKTTLIVTTDHGRGDHDSWTSHGPLWPESRYIWLYGRSPLTAGSQILSGRKYSHLDIRPTIEAALGLKPQSCSRCGQVITEIVPYNK